MFLDSIVNAHYRIDAGESWHEIANIISVAWQPARNILVDPYDRRVAVGEALLDGEVTLDDPEQLTELAGIGEYGATWFAADTLYPRFRFRWLDWEKYMWQTTFWPVAFCASQWRGGPPPSELSGGGQGLITRAMTKPNPQKCAFIIPMQHCEIPASPGFALFKNHILHERED